MKQSSIDWLAEKNEEAIKDFLRKINLRDNETGRAAGSLGLLLHEHLKTAREMHRKEIEEAYDKGFDDGQDDANGDGAFYDDKEHYYTETFKQNETNKDSNNQRRRRTPC